MCRGCQSHLHFFVILGTHVTDLILSRFPLTLSCLVFPHTYHCWRPPIASYVPPLYQVLLGNVLWFFGNVLCLQAPQQVKGGTAGLLSFLVGETERHPRSSLTSPLLISLPLLPYQLHITEPSQKKHHTLFRLLLSHCDGNKRYHMKPAASLWKHSRSKNVPEDDAENTRLNSFRLPCGVLLQILVFLANILYFKAIAWNKLKNWKDLLLNLFNSDLIQS